MLKRQAIFGIVFVILLAFSSSAWSDVVGHWDVTGEVTVKVMLKKTKTVKTTDPYEDTFIFLGDGDFQMTDMEGQWVYTNKKHTKFSVVLDEADVEAYFEAMIPIEATVTSMSFKGKQNKDGTISGTFKMKLSVTVTDGPNAGKTGKVDAKASFTGTALVPSSDTPKGTAPRLSGSVYDLILEKIAEAVYSKE